MRLSGRRRVVSIRRRTALACEEGTENRGGDRLAVLESRRHSVQPIIASAAMQPPLSPLVLRNGVGPPICPRPTSRPASGKRGGVLFLTFFFLPHGPIGGLARSKHGVSRTDSTPPNKHELARRYKTRSPRRTSTRDAAPRRGKACRRVAPEFLPARASESNMVAAAAAAATTAGLTYFSRA